MYVDGFAHINNNNETNPFDHISIPQNVVALSEDPFDDDSSTLQSSSKDSIPVRNLLLIYSLTHSLILL